MNKSEVTVLKEISIELESAFKAILDDSAPTNRGLALTGVARALGKLDFLLNKVINKGETK